MEISLFKNVEDPKNPEIISILDYLTDTRDGYWHKIVNHCRNLSIEDAKVYKKTMPTACLSGKFSYRDDKHLVSHNELLAIDLDWVDNLESIKNQLKKDKYTFSVFLSTYGQGLRWLIRIAPNKHKEAFKGAVQYLYQKYGLAASNENGPVDLNNSLSKPYIVSFDPDLYLNPDYKDIPIFNKYVKETVIKNVPIYVHNNDDFETIFKEIIGRRIDICQNYDDWYRLALGLAEEFGEKGRYYFHELSSLHEKYNHKRTDYQYNISLKRSKGGDKVSIKIFYYLAKLNGINIVSEKTKEVARVTRNSKKAGLSKKQIAESLKTKGGIEGVEELIDKIFDSTEKDSFDEENESTIETLEIFIKNQYSLRFNEISGFFEDHGRQITPTVMNSIFIAAKKLLPKLDYPLMIRLMKSDFIETYNPLFEFFGSDGIPVILPPIPDLNKKEFHSPLIDQMAECIINTDKDFTRYFLRKWLVSIISAAHKYHSPLLLCLLGPQGTGKTEYLRRLTPNELYKYYAESKLDKEKDDELLMTENLIIMDDELGGKSKQDSLKLKNITSKQWFSLRRPYGDHNEKILRLAVLCGTSNYKQVLTDPTGNRRIIPIWVDDIDKAKYNSIDKKELFMEMFRLYKEGFDWRVSHADLKMLNKDEEDYSIVIPERELVMKYFEPGDDFRMSSTDIFSELMVLYGQRLNQIQLGIQLNELGFMKKSTRVGMYNERVRSLWCVNKIGRNPSLFDANSWKPVEK